MEPKVSVIIPIYNAEKYNCDLVIADFYRVIGERLSHKGKIREDGLLTREEFALEMMENPADFYYGVLWNKLYRRELIVHNSLSMDKDISWCEDFIFNMEYIRHVEHVYALRVPIYYYVKTPGSLVSQGSSISKTIHMKRTVFKCYREFYKDVFKEEDYEKIRLQVYRFLIDAAGDGTVGPTILPGSRRLGDERIAVSLGIAQGSGFLFETYREGKLLDRYLETAAIKRDLSIEDIRLLFYLSQADEIATLKEISEVTRIKRRKLILSIQKLMNREMIRMKHPQELEKKTDYKPEFELLAAAEPVITDLIFARETYHQVKYAGLSEDEIEQYEMISQKINENIQKSLK